MSKLGKRAIGTVEPRGMNERDGNPWANIDMGLAIKNVRSLLHVTQQKLTQDAGVTINFLSMLENGKCGVSLTMVDTFAEALHVPVSSIMILGINPECCSSLVRSQIERLQETVKEELAESVRTVK